MYVIKIELKSNLCAADGDGYASVIDTDVVVDKYGIPFIPARRLKGCLREAAEYIYGKDNQVIDAVFGISGDYNSGSLKIENALIDEYDKIRELMRRYPSVQVTDLFTSTSASTAVEDDGRAKENSLRFMRYVTKEKAWDTSENLVFCAEIDIDEKYIGDMEKICKALRHIGYKRNRGFGCVRCTLEAVKNSALCNIAEAEDEKDYVLTYAIKLNENIMLPATTSDKSADYISGRSVVGAFAGKYLKSNKADETFDEIFLKDNLRFSNLYITNEAFEQFVPVPRIYGKTKHSSEIIDKSVTENSDAKPLKSGYINSRLEVKKILTERIYHNSIKDEDGGLYTRNCIQSGQVFMGTISGKGRYIRTIAELLKDGRISFGRSRSAQYSSCAVVCAGLAEAKEKVAQFKKGDKIIYLSESDIMLSDEYGNPTVSFAQVCETLGICADDVDKQNSVLNYKTIHGYLSVMRMQRTHIRAIAAGSVIVTVCSHDMKTPETVYIGGGQNEGYGKVRIFRAGELLKNSVGCLEVNNADNHAGYANIEKMFDNLEKTEKRRCAAINYVSENGGRFKSKWGAAFIGRVTLMVGQSKSESDLKKRICSIKNEEKKTCASNLLKDSANKLSSEIHYKNWNEQQEYLLMILTLAKYLLKEIKETAK